MDGYESIRETAERWGVSQRLVQKLCTEGRIQGAQKFSGAWAIPTDAAKPADLRRSRHREGDRAAAVETVPRPPVQTAGKTLMPLMNTPFVPGQCLAAVEAMEEGPQRDIALAEYHYFSGHPEEAAGEAERYFSSPDLGTRLSACLIYAFANLSLGCIEQARSALGEVERTLRAAGEAAPAFQAASGFVAATAAVLLHLPLPDGLPPAEGFMQQLPPGLRAFALYVQAHYLYLQGDYARSAGVAEATLAIGGSRYPIPAIYLNLVAVMDYMSLKQTARAESHLLAAWELARPDDLIEGFGEHHGLLGGMLESVIKREWPEEFRRIIAITYRFSWGWRRIHNPKTGGILFWDLDGRLPPASIDGAYALFLCSSSSSAAIASYSLHPAGFLRKPIGMEKLWAALHRCIKLWWDSLERLEITSDRCRVRLPLCDLVWAESTRRGSLVHSTQGPIATRETLTALEERLPKELFLRCQRGFLANLRHVRRLDSGGLHMSDGAVVPLSRSSRGETAEAYRKFCLLWDVRMRDGEKRHG